MFVYKMRDDTIFQRIVGHLVGSVVISALAAHAHGFGIDA